MGYWDNPGNAVVRQVSGLSGLDSPKVYNPFLNPAVPTIEDAQQSVAGALPALPFLLLGAERARDYADSHRDFRVGAAALAIYSKGHVKQQMIVHGANIKPVADDEGINIHAEHILLARIAAHSAPGETVRVPLLVVVGDVQSDEQSGRPMRTLHPCGMCRADFEDPRSPIDDSTVTVSAIPDMTQFEWYDLDGLQLYHSQGDDSYIGSAAFDTRLDVLAPLDIDAQHHRLIIERPPTEDERLFTSRITLPLLEYALAASVRSQA